MSSERSVSLEDLAEGFESYLHECSAWSDRAMKAWRREFRKFGVEGRTADDLLRAALAALGEEQG
jgi:hypothetical protein